MAISVNDLVQELTPQDVLDDLLAIATALGVDTAPLRVTGEPANAVLVIISEHISRLWNRYILPAIRAGFLDTSSGVWLTLLAAAVYFVFRRSATFATGPATIENRVLSAPFTILAGDVRIKNSVSGKTYTNQSGGYLAPWDGVSAYPTLELTFVADEVGSASSAVIGEIASYPEPLVSGPGGVYAITNSAALLAQDEELDESVQDRCRISTGPLGFGGPKSAIRSIALSVRRTVDGVPVLPWESGYQDAVALNITRCVVSDSGGGIVVAYLASASGAAAGDTSTEGTDVFIANAAIQIYAATTGITAIVMPAVEHAVTWAVTAYVDRASNVTSATAKAAAERALTLYGALLPIGGERISTGAQGYVWSDEAKAKASESSPGIFRATMTTGDVALLASEVAVPAISVTAVVVSQ